METPARHDRLLIQEAASTAIIAAASGQQQPLIENASALKESYSGVFVTIKVRSKLRGCIGYISIPGSFLQAVSDVAWKAAREDIRFKPLSAEDLDDVHFDITLLSEATAINDVEEIIIGEHGLILESGISRGLLLPQVPVEHHWNRHQFLEALCQKAGLPRDSWQDESSTLSRFSGVILKDNRKIQKALATKRKKKE